MQILFKITLWCVLLYFIVPAVAGIMALYILWSLIAGLTQSRRRR